MVLRIRKNEKNKKNEMELNGWNKGPNRGVKVLRETLVIFLNKV